MAVASENPRPIKPPVTVLHLVWAPLGLQLFQGFLQSYRQCPAGMPHRLHILYNGFESGEQTTAFRQAANDISHDFTILERPVQDIQAYIDASRWVDTEYVCFLNSYSIILHSDWLANLYQHASQESVGLVSATGSYESFLTALIITRWRAPLALGLAVNRWPQNVLSWTKDELRWRLRCWKARWSHQLFPNPHLRSNSFMIRRDVLLRFDFGPIRSKRDALLFENGRSNLTRRVLRSGKQALVVGSDRRGYRIEEWPVSRTYRSGNQENLLIADNRTIGFLAATAEEREMLTKLAWGELRDDQ